MSIGVGRGRGGGGAGGEGEGEVVAKCGETVERCGRVGMRVKEYRWGKREKEREETDEQMIGIFTNTGIGLQFHYI